MSKNTITLDQRTFFPDQFGYVGLLRNEKKFDLNEKVFFVHDGNKISFGSVIGIQLTDNQNPDYIYTLKFGRVVEDNTHKPKLKCKHIFRSIEEAKDSAMKNLEKSYRLQKQEIERYFNQFEKP